MKIALVTTTIGIPSALKAYRKASDGVRFFVIGDNRTPESIRDLISAHQSPAWTHSQIPNSAYYGVDDQKQLGYACSELIGWNSIQRRSIGLLEALKWGADVIVYWDDDNLMLDNEYFWNFTKHWWAKEHDKNRWYMNEKETWRSPYFNGLLASSPSGWFDVGHLLTADYEASRYPEHRGFPHTKRAAPRFESITDARIGVAAGICLGDPDVGAVERIANSPTVHNVSELLHAGVVTDPRHTTTVFNSQNTAFLRELAPAMFMIPGVGRYDDILASLVTQRVMREKNLHVHFGQPFVWQQRNQHDLIKDLKAEIFGMEKIEQFGEYLNRLVLRSSTVVEQVREILTGFDKLPHSYDLLPRATVEAGLAWCDDCEKVLG